MHNVFIEDVLDVPILIFLNVLGDLTTEEKEFGGALVFPISDEIAHQFLIEDSRSVE
jgi:hypothetical protein